MLQKITLPISESLEISKAEYFDRIQAVHNRGQYKQWGKFFLEMLIASANTTLERIDKMLQIRAKNVDLINNFGRDTVYLNNAYKYIENCIFLSVSDLANNIGVSYNTAARIVNELMELKILRLLNNQAHNRIYYYADFLDAVDVLI